MNFMWWTFFPTIAGNHIRNIEKWKWKHFCSLYLNAAYSFFISFCFPPGQHSFRPNFLAIAHQLKEEGFKASTESLNVSQSYFLPWFSTLVDGAFYFLGFCTLNIVHDIMYMLSPYFCPLALCYWSHFCLAVRQRRACYSSCLAIW